MRIVTNNDDDNEKTMTMTTMPPTTSCSDCTAFTLSSATDFSRASAFGEDRYDDVEEGEYVYDYEMDNDYNGCDDYNGWL